MTMASLHTKASSTAPSVLGDGIYRLLLGNLGEESGGHGELAFAKEMHGDGSMRCHPHLTSEQLFKDRPLPSTDDDGLSSHESLINRGIGRSTPVLGDGIYRLLLGNLGEESGGHGELAFAR
jgi:hypothetical protein